MNELLVTERSCAHTIAWLARTLDRLDLRIASSDTMNYGTCLHPAHLGGLRAVPAFDLHAALALSGKCPCLAHGHANCACEMAVVVAHDGCGAWAVLVAHGHGARTWIHMVETTAHFPRADLASAIRRTAAARPESTRLPGLKR